MSTVPLHPAGPGLEGSLCAAMAREGVDHEHRSLHFRVHSASGPDRTYEPALVARRGPVLFLLDPIEASAWSEDRRSLLEGFLRQHSADIVLVLVAAQDLIPRIPPEAYDEIYRPEDATAVARRIRDQDPKGLLLPFRKPSARGDAP